MPSRIMTAQGNPFVLGLQDALGLPRETVWFELRCAVDEVVTVQCGFHPQADGVAGWDPKPLLANYRLVPTACTTEGDPADAFVDELPTIPQPRGFREMEADQARHGLALAMGVLIGLVSAGAGMAAAHAFGLWL